jgi:hypothetical protein
MMLVVLAQKALTFLHRQPLVGKVGNALLEQRGRKNLALDVLGEAGVEYWLADYLVIGAPAGAGDVERNLA